MKKDIVQRSIDELEWHCEALDLMELDNSAKVQIHVGCVYGDKQESVKRFINNYKKLSEKKVLYPYCFCLLYPFILGCIGYYITKIFM